MEPWHIFQIFIPVWLYRVSKKKQMSFILEFAANLLLEFVCSHVHSHHEVVNNLK